MSLRWTISTRRCEEVGEEALLTVHRSDIWWTVVQTKAAAVGETSTN